MSEAPHRALIVIDVQNEYVSGNMLIEYPPVQQSLAAIGRAIDAAHAAGLPVVVVQHSAPATSPVFAKGSAAWQLHPVVASREHDHLIEKSMPSAFVDTDLSAWIAAHGIDTLVVAGYMTQHCDASTIVQAMHAGLKVEFLHDAAGSVPYANGAGQVSAEEIHRAYCVVLQSSFAAVLSTDEWIAALTSGAAPPRDNIVVSNSRARTARAEAHS